MQYDVRASAWPSRAVALVFSLLLAGATPSAQAAFITFIGSGTNPASNHGLSASAKFDLINASLLRVTLTNTSTQAYTGSNNFAVPSDVLTALFFDSNPSQLAANPLISATASSLVTGSGVGFGVTNGPINVSVAAVTGGWNFGNTPNNQGVGTVGLGVFQGLGGAAQLGYGIMNSAYGGNGNGGVTSRVLVRDNIVFDLSVTSGFDLNNIHNVRFQYGTSFSEPTLPGSPPLIVPAPPGLILALTGAVPFGLAFVRRRLRSVGG